MMFFAQEVQIKPGFDNWLENAGAVLAIAALVIHVVKSIMPKPALDRQLQMLKDTIMERLDEQEQNADNRIAKLREHLDIEVVRIHQRIDSHGRELYRLEGFVYGARDEAKRREGGLP